MRASNLWDESGLTLVVLPSGIQGEKLLKVAKEWTSLRLLAPSIWIDPEKLNSAPGAPPAVEALAIASTRAGEVKEVRVELFQQLARQQLSKVRLLVARPALPDLAFDLVQDKFVELISGYLEISVPKIQMRSELEDEGVSLVKLNLITGPTEHVEPAPNEMLDPLFNAHFVASAEDRSGPRTGDAFVKDYPDSDKFAGFTMLHIATLGALWQGLPKGGYELISASTWEGDSVYVSRVFVSAILTDGLIRRACARVIEAAADTHRGIEDLGVGLNIEGTYPIPDGEVDAWLDYLVDLTFGFDDSVLQYKPALEAPTPPKPKFGFLKQLGDFGVFAGGKLLRIPFYAFLWVVAKMAKLFNDLFQGGDKGSAKVSGPEENSDPKDLILLKKYDEVFIVKQKADEALVSPVGRGKLRSTPALWANLRKLLFGFVDGSNLHLFNVSRSENGWPVFYKISSMFNDPSEKATFSNPVEPSTQHVMGWGSTTETQALLVELSSSKKDTTQAMSTDLGVVVEAKRRSSELKKEIQQLAKELGIQDPTQPIPVEAPAPEVSEVQAEVDDLVLVEDELVLEESGGENRG